MSAPAPDVGAVVIGRNEGERLRRCLASLASCAARGVYVDSGSSDGSQELARAAGFAVVELSDDEPYTAARGRNAGWQRLARLHPEVRLVQFVDGDCELQPGWLEAARARLLERPELAVVCGRRRERAPERSLYNACCDVEWDTPVGEAEACGGDAMIRLAALRAVEGYDSTLIAGEEPDLCVRLRLAGWKVERIAAEMTLHDAAMTSAGQWWRRAVRGGWAYAEGAHRHGRGPTRHWVREVRRVWVWGFGVPAAALALAPLTAGASLLLLGVYPLNALRAYRQARGRGRTRRDAAAWGASCALAKLPELVGLARFHLARLRGRRGRLIEYKAPEPA